MTSKWVPNIVLTAPCFGPGRRPGRPMEPRRCPEGEKRGPGFEILRKSQKSSQIAPGKWGKKDHNLSLGLLRFALTTAGRVPQIAGGCRTQRRSQVGQKSKNTPRTSPKPRQRHPASGSPNHSSPPRCAEGRHKTPRHKLGAAVVPPRGGSIKVGLCFMNGPQIRD